MNTTERIGVSKVQLIVYEKLHWVFREQPIDDCGIDAHIELIDDNCAMGKLIATQIKSGESYFRNKSNNAIVYYIDEKHLNYWKSNVLPVIIILYNPKTEECIWDCVDKIDEERKVFINIDHFFDEKAKNELIEIANVELYKKTQVHWRKYIENNKSLDVLQKFMHTKGKKKNKDNNNIYHIAIDFGTTRTMIGLVSENGEDASIVKTFEGKNYIDTVIGFDENYQYYVGADALKMKDNPFFILVKNFKRELGYDKKYQIFNLIISVEDITVLFLRTIIDYIEVEYGICIEKCCISEPVDFSYFQKQVYEQCIKKCNLCILKKILESTCVSINRELCYKEALTIIIDVGGGTFDISYIETGDGVSEVLNVIGDRSIGGVDYDLALGKYIKELLKSKYQGILIDSFLENQIIFKAEEVKILLATMEKVTVFFHNCYCTKREMTLSCCLEISRNDFKNVTKSLNLKVENILKEFKSQIKNNSSYSKEILLAGLGSDIFTINELIKEYFSNIPIRKINTNKKVVEGLVAHLKSLVGKYGTDVLLLNVTEFNLILEGENLFDVDGGEEKSSKTLRLTEKVDRLEILCKNTTIFTGKSTYFGIINDQQISIWVACGKHRERVLTYDLKNIKEKTIYEIRIDVNARGLISGIIKENNKQSIIWEFTL